MELNVTLVIVALTVLASISAFRDQELFDKLKFNAWMIKYRREWIRFLGHGFIHVDVAHLAVNMYVLYSFGSFVEDQYNMMFGQYGRILYVLLYIVAIAVSSIYSYLKHQNHDYYNAVGASGAVSAVLFAAILFMPRSGGIGLLFIPGLSIPAPVFGVLYLIYSAVMAKRGRDNVGHDAHFWGAVFGFGFTIALKPYLFIIFIQQLFGLD